MAEKDQKFVEMVVKELVDNPGDVKVERTIDERGVLLTLSVNPEDMGKVIGKEGKAAKAVRTLLRVVGAKDDARVNLKILEPEGSERTYRSDSQTEPVAPVEQPAQDKTPDESPPSDDVKPIEEEEEKATEII